MRKKCASGGSSVTALTADGTQFWHRIRRPDSRGFKEIKQIVVLVATWTAENPEVKIMRFISPTQFYVGPKVPTAGQGLQSRADISAYTVAAGAYVYAAEQDKVTIKPDDIWQAIYRQEREHYDVAVQIDDQWGRPIDTVIGPDGKNRLAVDAEITIESIEIGTADQGAPNTPANCLASRSNFGPVRASRYRAKRRWLCKHRYWQINWTVQLAIRHNRCCLSKRNG